MAHVADLATKIEETMSKLATPRTTIVTKGKLTKNGQLPNERVAELREVEAILEDSKDIADELEGRMNTISISGGK
jgi:hypothetical protein